MNQQLKGRVFKLPLDVISHLNHYLSVLSNSDESTERTRNLVNTGVVTYELLKKILHDLEYIDKENNSDKYNLYGGEPMKTWGWSILGGEREQILKNKNMSKTSKNITGLGKNAFLKTHEKKDSFKERPTTFKTNSSSSLGTLLPSMKLFEQIKNIKRLMK